MTTNVIQEARANKVSSPRNFQKKSKQSFEMQLNRTNNMVNTMDSFFDRNKLYIKSVQQEAVNRGNNKGN